MIKAVEKYSPTTKVVLVTSVGCAEQWDLISPLAQQALGEALKAKTEAEAYLQQTALNWLIIRPGGLNNDEVNDEYQIVRNLPNERKMYVSRKSVATGIVRLLDSTENHQIFSIINRG